MSNVVDFHSPAKVQAIYDEALTHIRDCVQLIERLPDAQLYPLLAHSIQRLSQGSTLMSLTLHELIFRERAGRGGRGE